MPLGHLSITPCPPEEPDKQHGESDDHEKT
jgi:hypothetical protein